MEQYEKKVINNETKAVNDQPVVKKSLYSFAGENYSVEAESLEEATRLFQSYKLEQTKK